MEADTIYFVLLVIFSYLLGSIPFAILVTKLLGGVDPRSVGSGNIGATNVSRTSGKFAGVLTLFLDALKGAVPTLLALHIFSFDIMMVSVVGFAAFFGHLYPVYLRFKGGKGVATATGVMLVLSPVPLLLSMLVIILLIALTKYVSLGSIAASVMFPIFVWFFEGDMVLTILAAAIGIFIIIKHIPNIRRLLKGTEEEY
jgi:glycerol-3-phosphate acyltransferase PlsY